MIIWGVSGNKKIDFIHWVFSFILRYNRFWGDEEMISNST